MHRFSCCHASRILGSTIALLAMVLSGCLPLSEAPLRVGDVPFHEASIRGLSLDQQALLASIAILQEALGSSDGIVQAGVVYQESWIRNRRVERLREEIILAGAGISEAELEAYYQGRPAWELEVRHLVVLAEPWETAEARGTARRSAEQALNELKRGDPFEEVVARWSEEPGAASRGGLLRPGREGTWVRPFWDAALALEEGEISSVIETPFGFHVLRLEKRRTLPFQEVRTAVVREVAAELGGGAIWEEARQELLSGILIIPPEAAPRPTLSHLFELVPGPEGPDKVKVDPDNRGVLAHWEGGVLTYKDFVHYLRGRSAQEVLGAGRMPERMEELVVSAAAQVRLETMADLEGLRIPSEEVVIEMQRWMQTALEWVSVLGLAPGGNPSARAERALAALRRTGQNATIAREQIRDASPALLSALPVVWDEGLHP